MLHRRYGGCAILSLVVFAACAQPGRNSTSDGGGDGAVPDLAEGDLAGADFAGVDFMPQPDLWMACNVNTQTGCGQGEKCTLGNKISTCLSDGNKANGQICGPTTDDCVKGTLCTGETASLSQCRQFCIADGDCKQAAIGPTGNIPHCIIGITGAMQEVCTVACNPVLAAGASGCGAGLACQVFRTMAIPQATDCSVGGAGGDAADCKVNGNRDCMAGFGCVSVTNMTTMVTESRCRKLCRAAPNTPSDCNPLVGYGCVGPGTNPMYGFCCPTTGC